MQFHVLSFEGPDEYARAAGSPVASQDWCEPWLMRPMRPICGLLATPRGRVMKAREVCTCTVGASGLANIIHQGSMRRRKEARRLCGIVAAISSPEMLLPYVQNRGHASSWQRSGTPSMRSST